MALPDDRGLCEDTIEIEYFYEGHKIRIRPKGNSCRHRRRLVFSPGGSKK